MKIAKKKSAKRSLKKASAGYGQSPSKDTRKPTIPGCALAPTQEEMDRLTDYFADCLNTAVKADLPDFAASRGQDIPDELRG